MKTYQKPIMIALSLTGNEQLCGSCANPLRPDLSPGLNRLFDLLVGNRDGTLTKEEFDALFGPGEGCKREVGAYCKFTAGGIGELVAWS